MPTWIRNPSACSSMLKLSVESTTSAVTGPG
jgi:hypothetical protein